MMKRKRGKRKGGLTALLCVLILVFLAACGTTSSKDNPNAEGSTGSASGADTLAAVNEIPENGVITKAQFASVAGQDKKIKFKGASEDGQIEYVWTFDASKIQNPQDQNLKISFETADLGEVKKEANNATDALQMTMAQDGLIAVPTLKVTLKDTTWESNTAVLLKEQDGSLAKMSDVTIKAEKEKTVLSMTVTAMDGTCYVAGGIAKTANNDGAAENDTAEASGESSPDAEEEVSEEDADKADASDDGDSDGGDETSNTGKTCTISIDCSTILDNMDSLKAGKEEFVPSNGQILAPSEVAFSKGDTVFDVLKATCREAGIAMEFSNSPVYGSAYIEGINQLYEFDCGELSGWMYSVNGWFPNYGCSKYKVSEGDDIRFVYTCNLGKDVGDNSNQ